MRNTDTNIEQKERHCSYCVHYWKSGGQMYCTLRIRRITAAKRNGCSSFLAETDKSKDKPWE